MQTSSLDREIRARIEVLLTDISQLVKSSALAAVQSALGGPDTKTASPARRGPGRPSKTAAASAPAARKGTRAKRTPEDVIATANAFLDYVRANEGRRLEEIAKGMSVSSKELKLPVIKLIEAGSLRTEGRKRGTKYFAGGGGTAKKAGKRGRRSKKA